MDSQYQIINLYYIRERKDRATKQKIEDALIIAYKVDGVQKLQIIETPKFSFYVAKPNIEITHYLDNIPIEDVDKVTINYKDLSQFLAKYCGKEQVYWDLKNNYNMDPKEKATAQKNLINSCQANPYLFGTDVDIEDYYKMEFVKKYGINIGQYKKAVFDIETDGISDQHQALHPINCWSYYDLTTDTFYAAYWDQPDRWPRFKEFKQMVLDGRFEQELRDDPEMNGKYEEENALPAVKTINDTKFVFKFFEDEFDLICYFFQVLHDTSPDFAMAWNFTFDVLYLINRAIKHIQERNLSIRIEDIICDPNIPAKYRTWRYEEDINPLVDYYLKWHYFMIPGKTTFVDSMSMWANIRKSKGVQPSYALNDICQKELKKGKVDYKGIAETAAELPYKDFVVHGHYNIRDTLLLGELEIRNNDIDSMMYMGEYTRLKKVTKQTATLKNAQQIFYLDKGLVIGNNHNVFVPQPKIGYVGAVVADLMNNDPIITPLFPYWSSTIRPFVIDNDLTSMYPMMAISHNIYKTTLIFQVTKIGNLNDDSPDSPGIMEVNEVFDNYQCNQPTRWGHDYLQLPDFGELADELYKELGRFNKGDMRVYGEGIGISR